MTDKQIIIDSIDVSGCAYFYNRECRCLLDCVNHYENKPIQELFNRDTQIHTNCETSPNCYYKQLKRTEKCKAVIKLKQALKNIAEGRIGKCCCPEEYAMEVLDERSKRNSQP